MKPIRTIPVTTLLALAAAAALFCASPTAGAATYKYADKTGESLAEFRDEIINIKKEVDLALKGLDQIVTTSVTDPRKAFKAFDKAVPRVDSAAKKAKKRADDMRAKGAAYFEQWEKELAAVKNEEVRALAVQRRAKLQATFASIKTMMEPARENFQAFNSDLNDLRSYLGNDLTVAGIDAAKTLIAKTKSEGATVQQNLDKVIAELNTILATITPAKVKPASP